MSRRTSNAALVVVALAGTAFMPSCRAGKIVYAAFHSGAPSREERRQIDARSEVMLRALSRSRIVVLPVAVIGKPIRYDSGAARALVTRLNADSLRVAVLADGPIELPFEPSSNEAAILWSRFKSLSARVRGSPVAGADYVLLVDVFGSPERGRVAAVHVMAVTGAGQMAYRRAWNSSHKLYKEIQPKSAEDAMRMVARDFELHRGTSDVDR